MSTIRIGMVGSGFMCRAHSVAYRSAHFYWPHLPSVDLVRLADIDASAARTGAERFGWRDSTTDWRAVTQAADIDVVDIVTPNDTHAEIALDAIAHGKHVVCEKPLAHKLEDAQRMRDAALRAGIVHQVNFVYRRWPAIAFAKELIDQGRLGALLSFHGQYLQDYGLDRQRPMMWRFDRKTAGAGSIGDTGPHIIDLANHLVGKVSRVAGQSRTVFPQRPSARRTGQTTNVEEMVAVDVDDSFDVLLEFANGAVGSLRTSWIAAGHKNDLGFEVAGELGALSFGWPHNNEFRLVFFDSGEQDVRKQLNGVRTVVMGSQHPGAEVFWPAGQGIGWSEAFLLGARDLLESVATGVSKSPNFEDGLRVNQVIAAAQVSADEKRWVDLDTVAAAPSLARSR